MRQILPVNSNETFFYIKNVFYTLKLGNLFEQFD